MQAISFEEVLKCLASSIYNLKVDLSHPRPIGSLQCWYTASLLQAAVRGRQDRKAVKTRLVELLPAEEAPVLQAGEEWLLGLAAAAAAATATLPLALSRTVVVCVPVKMHAGCVMRLCRW